jgi:hypothetical protein
MNNYNVAAGLLALIAWSMTPAHAASFDTKPCTDGGPGCYLMRISGEIMPGDAKRFTDLVKAKVITSGVVYLDSPGGLFEDGMAIAKLVRQRRFFTYVGDGACMSMCAIIWIAGDTRYYTGKSIIGFHGIVTLPTDNQGNRVKGGKATPYNGGNALVGAFFNQIGLNDKAIATLTNAGFDSAFYLNTKNIEELGIKAERWVTPSPGQG